MVTRCDQKKDADINDRAYSRTSKGLAVPQRGAGMRKVLLRKLRQRAGLDSEWVPRTATPARDASSPRSVCAVPKKVFPEHRKGDQLQRLQRTRKQWSCHPRLSVTVSHAMLL